MIISGGENVYPSEVENMLGAHEHVKEVAVVGAPDPKWGERVHAVVVLHAGATVTEAEIVAWCRDRIAGYKRPRSVSFIGDDEMPRTATGKILHRVPQDPLFGTRDMSSIDLNADETACAAWVARFLKARGVDRIFGLQGGHIQPIWDHVARQGIRIIDVRDEGAAVHMAHAHAELTGMFGVAMATAGPGVTNTVTAMANASLARAPVLLIGGCTSRPQANMGPLQDIPHVDILRPVTRTSRTARVAEQVVRELDEAVARAMGDMGEPGPVYIEIPTDVLRTSVPSAARARGMDDGKTAAPRAAGRRRHRVGRRRLVVGAAPAGCHGARRQECGAGARAPSRCERRALSRHPGEPRPGARRSSGRGRRRARAPP